MSQVFSIAGASQPISLPSTPGMPGVHPPADGPKFKDILLSSIREVNAVQQEAERAVEALAAGEELSPAEVLIAVQKADIAFRLMMQIRNKLVQVYQEVQNIRV